MTLNLTAKNNATPILGEFDQNPSIGASIYLEVTNCNKENIVQILNMLNLTTKMMLALAAFKLPINNQEEIQYFVINMKAKGSLLQRCLMSNFAPFKIHVNKHRKPHADPNASQMASGNGRASHAIPCMV